MGTQIPLFFAYDDVFSGFQTQGGSLTCMLSCLHTIPQIHLLCNTCRPIDASVLEPLIFPDFSKLVEYLGPW